MTEEYIHHQHQQAMLKLLREFNRICKRLDIPYILFSGTLLGAVRHEGFIPWDDDLDVMLLRSDYNRFLHEAPALLDADSYYLQKEFSAHWPMFFTKLRLNRTTCLEKFHPKDPEMHQGIYMDIFPCDDAADTRIGRGVQFLSSKVVIAKALYMRGYETRSIVKKLFMLLCRPMPTLPFWRMAINGKREGRYVHTFFAGASRFKKNLFPRSFLTDVTLAEFEGDTYPIPREYDALLRRLFGDYMQEPAEKMRSIKKHAYLVDLENTYQVYENALDDITFHMHTRSIR